MVGVQSGYKWTEVGVIPEDWEIKNLGGLGECIIGLTYRPTDVKPDGTLVLRSSNIGENRLKFDDNVFVDVDVPDRLIVRKGDILVCVRNGSRNLIGKCALIDENAEGMTFGAFMSVFRSEAANYIFYQFQSDIIKRQIEAHLGATINQITNKSLNSFQIPMPPTSAEQRAITDVLNEFDEQIATLDDIIAKKRNLKQATMQRLLTGEERLPGFSGTWEVKRLKDIGEALIGLTYSPDNVVADGILVLRSSNIQNERLIYTDNVYVDMPIPNQIITRKDDILICVRNGSRELIGKCALIDEQAAGITFGAFMSVFRTPYARFVFYQFQSNLIQEQIAKNIGATINQITNKNLYDFEIPFPKDEQEQTAITSVLSDMDAEISTLEEKREKTVALKQGMMQELLTGKTRLV